jgi:hypothetical protein
MKNKKKPKETIKEWKKQNKAAQRKLKAYKEEEASFMKRENNGSKQAKLKKL